MCPRRCPSEVRWPKLKCWCGCTLCLRHLLFWLCFLPGSWMLLPPWFSVGFFFQLTLRKWWEEVNLVDLRWWVLQLLSLFFTYSWTELGELLSLGHCKAAGSRLQLEGEVRGWEMQVVMGEASKHQEPERCGWSGSIFLGAQVQNIGLFQENQLRIQRLWDGLPC